MSFADAHVELHPWVDSRTRLQVRYNVYLPLNLLSPNNPDILWLTERTPSAR